MISPAFVHGKERFVSGRFWYVFAGGSPALVAGSESDIFGEDLKMC
jgi:hypothetical protein